MMIQTGNGNGAYRRLNDVRLKDECQIKKISFF